MAMRVHSFFGPGFLEEVYKNALLVELEKSGLKYEKRGCVFVFKAKIYYLYTLIKLF